MQTDDKALDALAKRLRDYLARTGWSQRRTADTMGVGHPRLGALLHGRYGQLRAGDAERVGAFLNAAETEEREAAEAEKRAQREAETKDEPVLPIPEDVFARRGAEAILQGIVAHGRAKARADVAVIYCTGVPDVLCLAPLTGNGTRVLADSAGLGDLAVDRVMFLRATSAREAVRKVLESLHHPRTRPAPRLSFVAVHAEGALAVDGRVDRGFRLAPAVLPAAAA